MLALTPLLAKGLKSHPSPISWGRGEDAAFSALRTLWALGEGSPIRRAHNNNERQAAAYMGRAPWAAQRALLPHMEEEDDDEAEEEKWGHQQPLMGTRVLAAMLRARPDLTGGTRGQI